MSLVSGPGRGGASTDDGPDQLELVVEKHVQYITSLDSVRSAEINEESSSSSSADSAKMNLSIG